MVSTLDLVNNSLGMPTSSADPIYLSTLLKENPRNQKEAVTAHDCKQRLHLGKLITMLCTPASGIWAVAAKPRIHSAGVAARINGFSITSSLLYLVSQF